MTTTACKPWCGKHSDYLPRGQANAWWTKPNWHNYDPVFCEEACMKAGKPMHPVSKPPGEPTPATGRTPACGECGGRGAHDRDCMSRHVPFAPAPGALPLPGPPTCPTCPPGARCPMLRLNDEHGATIFTDGRPVDEDEADEATGARRTAMELYEENIALRRDLAEARTALAEMKRAVVDDLSGIADERDEARARLAVTVGALERIANWKFQPGVHYATQTEEWQGIARAALAPTGAPPKKET